MGDTTAKAREIAGELQAARSVAQRLFGERYAEKVEPWREIVRGAAETFGCRAIEVPLRLDARGELPANPLLLFAAVVDEVEGVPA